MTDFRPFGNDDRKMMWHVLARWAAYTPTSTPAVMAHIRRHFAPILRPETLDHEVKVVPLPMSLKSRGWIVGGELERHPGVIPVVTVALPEVDAQGSAVEAAIRVALLRQRNDTTVHAEGWRFEQAEVVSDQSSLPAHPFAHAQAIVGWTRDVRCLIHPPHEPVEACPGIDESTDEDLNAERTRARDQTLVRHPAFPVGTRTASGLAMSVIATLHGAKGMQRVVKGDTQMRRLPAEIKADFQMLGLG